MKNLNSRFPTLSRPASCLAGVILFGGLITASLAINPSLVRADDPNRTSYLEFMDQYDFYQTQLVLGTDEHLMGRKIWGSYDKATGLYYAINPADLPGYATKLTEYFEELDGHRQKAREIRARIRAQEKAQQEQANKPAPVPPNNNPSPPASTPEPTVNPESTDQLSTEPPADNQLQPPPDQPATKVVRITHPTPPPPTPMTRPDPQPESSSQPEVAAPATVQPETDPPTPDPVDVDEEVETQTEEIVLAPLEIVSSAAPASPQVEAGDSVSRPILWGVAAVLVTFAVLAITTLSHRRQR